jgi:hypothetical protein
VQKVGATTEEQVTRDIKEFCETDSARRVLERLGKKVQQEAGLDDSRFLYLHATFGSGKTHLLKLIGYATGEAEAPASAAGDLSTRFDGFRALRKAMDEAPADRFVPVFLNLLNRDASKEPPIPVLIYRAIGERLGYPKKPNWLTEFLLNLELKAPEADVWQRIQEYRVDGDPLTKDKGTMRRWLYAALPDIMEAVGVTCTEDEVRAWIDDAEKQVSEERFGASALNERIRMVQSLLSKRSGQKTELIIGLDEIALFIGNERGLYEELQATMEALRDDTNPVVIGTGQWGLKGVHADFVGRPDSDAWYSQEVELEGADTEEIVQKRWLQKASGSKPQIEDVLGAMPDPPETLGNGATTDQAVVTYPFRAHDLHWIREAMQRLLTKGRTTATDHIQGRALLVLVRSLFVRQGWADKPLGAVVPWTEVFEVLRSETNLIPLWVEELLSRLETTVARETDAPVQEVAKAVFLANRVESISATEQTIAYLLLDHVEAEFGALHEAVQEALSVLQQKKYIFQDDSQAPPEYRLLTEEEVSVAERVEECAKSVPYNRLRAVIKKWMRDSYESLLYRGGNRQEVKLGDERGIPLTTHYSILKPVPGPSDQTNTVSLRILVVEEGTDEEVKTWVEQNQKAPTLEDGLVVAELPPNYVDQLRRHIAQDKILDQETGNYPELRSTHAQDRNTLRQQARDALDAAEIIDSNSGQSQGRFKEGLEAFVVDKVLGRKFPNRKALKRPLQPIDDGPALWNFFHNDGTWPLSDEDAETLGVDLTKKDRKDGDTWPNQFLEEAEQISGGAVLDGEQVVGMIESKGGAFLGTSEEALKALLLVLATDERIQLLRDGELIRDRSEMGRSVGTKTNIRQLTLRLEPPPDQTAVNNIRALLKTLTGATSTPEDASEAAHKLATWAQEQAGMIERVHQFVEQNFSNVAVQKLVDCLQTAGAEPTKVDTDIFVDETLQEQAEDFYRARAFEVGEETELWEKFTAKRREMREKQPDAWSTLKMEEVSRMNKMPEASEVRDAMTEGGKPSEPPPPPPQPLESGLQKLWEMLDERATDQIVVVRSSGEASG